MNINKERCRYYAGLLEALANGTHTAEDIHGTPQQDLRISLVSDGEYFYRAVEIKQPPKTVTVYVWRSLSNGALVATHVKDMDVSDYVFVKSVEINLDDDDTPPSATAGGVVDWIDWDALPDQAKYVAMDESGDWYWYEDKPVMRTDAWDSNLNFGFIQRCQSTFIVSAGGHIDWTKSLRSRPQPK